MASDGTAIPVVMYHTVGRSIPDWNWSFLTVPYEIFTDHLKWLVKSGYKTVDLDELSAHVTGEKILPKRSVVLTFDDGYLDSWTHVAPLLSRYGLKGTVFVNPEFVDPRNITRPSLEDVWEGKCRESELEVRGFMSWPELRQLAEKGPLSIQSHAMSHTWYPTGDTIIDFHHPEDGYYWLDWNSQPRQKPFYLLDPQKTLVPLGAPVYEHGKSLAVTRFFPDPEEAGQLVGFVKERGGSDFFAKPDWRQQLFNKAKKVRESGNCRGRMETPEEQTERYLFELTEAKRILEKRLSITTDFLCWPGGGYNEKSREMALKIYRAVTLSSGDNTPVKNCPGDNAALIRRCGVPGIEYKGQIRYAGGRYFIRFLDEYRGVSFARFRRQVLKFLYLLAAFLR